MPGSSMNGIRDKSIFLSFSAYLIPFSLKNNTRKRFFFYFLNFLAIFFGIFLPWSSMNRIRDYNFFLSILGYLTPSWQKIMLERGFLIFSIFFLFFSEFSFPGRVLVEFGTKIFFSFSRPISSRFG